MLFSLKTMGKWSLIRPINDWLQIWRLFVVIFYVLIYKKQSGVVYKIRGVLSHENQTKLLKLLPRW